MEQLKLMNGQIFTLAVNGISEVNETLKLTFEPGLYTFDQIEEFFSNQSNTQKIYVLDSLGEPVRSLVGYTKYKGMEKVLDYILSSEMVAQEDTNPIDYLETHKTGTVMIVTMSKPDIEDRVKTLEADMVNTMLALTEIYEGSL